MFEQDYTNRKSLYHQIKRCLDSIHDVYFGDLACYNSTLQYQKSLIELNKEESSSINKTMEERYPFVEKKLKKHYRDTIEKYQYVQSQYKRALFAYDAILHCLSNETKLDDCITNALKAWEFWPIVEELLQLARSNNSASEIIKSQITARIQHVKEHGITLEDYYQAIGIMKNVYLTNITADLIKEVEYKYSSNCSRQVFNVIFRDASSISNTAAVLVAFGISFNELIEMYDPNIIALVLNIHKFKNGVLSVEQIKILLANYALTLCYMHYPKSMEKLFIYEEPKFTFEHFISAIELRNMCAKFILENVDEFLLFIRYLDVPPKIMLEIARKNIKKFEILLKGYARFIQLNEQVELTVKALIDLALNEAINKDMLATSLKEKTMQIINGDATINRPPFPIKLFEELRSGKYDINLIAKELTLLGVLVLDFSENWEINYRGNFSMLPYHLKGYQATPQQFVDLGLKNPELLNTLLELYRGFREINEADNRFNFKLFYRQAMNEKECKLQNIRCLLLHSFDTKCFMDDISCWKTYREQEKIMIPGLSIHILIHLASVAPKSTELMLEKRCQFVQLVRKEKSYEPFLLIAKNGLKNFKSLLEKQDAFNALIEAGVSKEYMFKIGAEHKGELPTLLHCYENFITLMNGNRFAKTPAIPYKEIKLSDTYNYPLYWPSGFIYYISNGIAHHMLYELADINYSSYQKFLKSHEAMRKLNDEKIIPLQTVYNKAIRGEAVEEMLIK